MKCRIRTANWKSTKLWVGLVFLAIAVTVMVLILDMRSSLNQQDMSEINDIKTHVANMNSSLRKRLDLVDSCK